MTIIYDLLKQHLNGVRLVSEVDVFTCVTVFFAWAWEVLFTCHFTKNFFKTLKKSQQPCSEGVSHRNRKWPWRQCSVTGSGPFRALWLRQMFASWNTGTCSCRGVVSKMWKLAFPQGIRRVETAINAAFHITAAPSVTVASIGAALISSGHRTCLPGKLEEEERKLRSYVGD